MGTRERSGGQGYLSCNRFGTFLGLAHAAMTAEGDNSVLMQKVAKERLGELMKSRTKIPLPSSGNSRIKTIYGIGRENGQSWQRWHFQYMDVGGERSDSRCCQSLRRQS